MPCAMGLTFAHPARLAAEGKDESLNAGMAWGSWPGARGPGPEAWLPAPVYTVKNIVPLCPKYCENNLQNSIAVGW